MLRVALAVAFAPIVAAAACFVDSGPGTTGNAESAGESTSTSSTSSSSSTAITSTSSSATTAPPAPACGDGQVDEGEACDDGNQIDEDTCLSTCVLAACGDGVIQAGVEACDDGPANHPTAPGACRPGCALPACGDGAIYPGPFAAPIAYGFSFMAPTLGDNGRRPAAIDDQGRVIATLAWSDGFVTHGVLRRLSGDGVADGAPVEVYAAAKTEEFEVDVSGDGRSLVAWTGNGNNADILVQRYGKALQPQGMPIAGATADAGIQQAATVSIAGNGDGIVVFGASGGNDPANRIARARRLPLNGDPPPDFVVGDGGMDAAEALVVDLRDDGSFVVAYPNSAGVVFAHHVGADDQPLASILAEGLVSGVENGRAGVGVVALADGEFAVAAPKADDHLTLARFDAGGAPLGEVQISSAPLGTIPRIDLAADGAGNVAALWLGCGDPGFVGDCAGKPATLHFRWIHRDDGPVGEVALVATVPLWNVQEIGVDSNARGDVVVVYQDAAPQLRIALAACP